MKKLLVTAALLLLVLLSGCALTQPEPTPVPVNEADPVDLDEAQLRERIAGADAADALLCYGQLQARDLLTQADYEALAALYEQGGDIAAQREALLKELLLYPSEETAQKLSAILVRRGPEDAKQAALAGQAVELLLNEDALGMKALAGSEAWNEAFQDGLRAVEIRSLYEGDEGRMQLTSSYQLCELSFLAPDGSYRYFRAEPAGTVLASAVYADGAYNGPARTQVYDGEDNALISYDTTLTNNICSGELLIHYQDKDYTGKLNEDGTTASSQEYKITSAGGVIYAWSGSNYLYKDGVEKDSFVLDNTLIGLPLYSPWEEG